MKNMKFIALVVALAFVALSFKSTPKKTETSTSTSFGAV